MDTAEFNRLIDSICRERGLEKELIYADIEKALVQAAGKRFDQIGDFSVTIDRVTGEIRAFEDEEPVELPDLGRIVANVFKQVFMQRVREGERDLVYDEFEKKLHTVISGEILRVERSTVIVQLGRSEAILPREEQIPGEIYRPGSSIRAYLLTVAKKGQRVRLVLSRTHTAFVNELFEAEIPEIGDGLIKVHHIVREPGRRTKIAVSTDDPRIDPVGSCVGVRGSRITKIADELGGEKIDIIPWSDDPAQFIINSLKPANILEVSYDIYRDRARVVVSQDQLPLAIGKGGQNVRLSARLTRYKIDIKSEEQVREDRSKGFEQLQTAIDAGLLEDFLREIFLDEGLDSLSVIAAQTVDAIVDGMNEHGMTADRAEALIAFANEHLDDEGTAERDELVQRRLEAERRAAAEAEAEAQAVAHAAAEAALKEAEMFGDQEQAQ